MLADAFAKALKSAEKEDSEVQLVVLSCDGTGKELGDVGTARCSLEELVEAGKALINVVQKGEYAGVPETMLDMPLPHVPERLREKKLKKLLKMQ